MSFVNVNKNLKNIQYNYLFFLIFLMLIYKKTVWSVNMTGENFSIDLKTN